MSDLAIAVAQRRVTTINSRGMFHPGILSNFTRSEQTRIPLTHLVAGVRSNRSSQSEASVHDALCPCNTAPDHDNEGSGRAADVDSHSASAKVDSATLHNCLSINRTSSPSPSLNLRANIIGPPP